MPRKCQIAREIKREKLINKYAKQRNKFRKEQKNLKLSIEQRETARFKLNQLPRDSSPGRFTRRCYKTGTSRGVYRKFKLNRISFRTMALTGLLPGVTKSSW